MRCPFNRYIQIWNYHLCITTTSHYNLENLRPHFNVFWRKQRVREEIRYWHLTLQMFWVLTIWGYKAKDSHRLTIKVECHNFIFFWAKTIFQGLDCSQKCLTNYVQFSWCPSLYYYTIVQCKVTTYNWKKIYQCNFHKSLP